MVKYPSKGSPEVVIWEYSTRTSGAAPVKRSLVYIFRCNHINHVAKALCLSIVSQFNDDSLRAVEPKAIFKIVRACHQLHHETFVTRAQRNLSVL